MRKILVFGNSGSGKSTLAARLCKTQGLAHLDLDTLAWQASSPPQRRAIAESRREIERFVHDNKGWVIEGCYTDLLEIAEPFASKAIFMNLSVELCQQNARARPWEPHKFPSKEAQDKNLAMLLDWIAQYNERDDVFSYDSHRRFYERFPRAKSEVTGNV